MVSNRPPECAPNQAHCLPALAYIAAAQIHPPFLPHIPGMSGSPDPSQKFEIPSEFEQLEMVVDAAEAFYRACFEDEEKIFTGVLLASEAVTNAIEHGNAHDASKRVFIEFTRDGGRVECWVEDEGEGFDREAIADPLASENLLEDGGRGIFLIERLADQVRYEKGGRRIGFIMSA